MEDQLKNIKQEITETTFKDFQFGSKQRQAVFRKLKNSEYNDKQNRIIQRFRHPFRGVLTILVYCGMLAIITTIVVDYIHETKNSQQGHSGVVRQPDQIDEDLPGKINEQGPILTSSQYVDETFSFKLDFPNDWINKVNVEELENSRSFYMMGKDGSRQNIFTISIDKVEDRLKFYYDGGPDPSTDFAILDNDIYRYNLPLDLALTDEEDVSQFGKLSAEVPSIIKSFSFLNGRNGLIEETPYLYGFSSQYNPTYRFEINTPNKWQNLFRVEQSEKEMNFLFEKEATKPTEFLSIKFLTEEEWQELKSSSNEENELTELAKKDDIVFVAAITKENPFEDSSLFYPFDMLKTEAKYAIETFQFLD